MNTLLKAIAALIGGVILIWLLAYTALAGYFALLLWSIK